MGAQNEEIKRLNREEGYVEFLAEHCVVENAREVQIHTVAGMCDNKHRWTIKQNSEGDYRINTHGFAYSNWGIKHRKDDIEWTADDGNWKEVFKMINTGTSKIESIKYR